MTALSDHEIEMLAVRDQHARTFTTADVVAIKKCGRSWAKDTIGRWYARGAIVPAKVRRTDVSGRLQTVSGWEFADEFQRSYRNLQRQARVSAQHDSTVQKTDKPSRPVTFRSWLAIPRRKARPKPAPTA